MFRYPKDEVQTNLKFYQGDYHEGVTSEVPSDGILKKFIDCGFSGTQKDLSQKIQIIKLFKQTGRVLDYGCSWGYGVWQFQRAGFEAIGFDISKPRALFGMEKLGAKVISSQTELDSVPSSSFDVIFSNHVLEHLPHLFSVFKEFERLLKEDGLIIIFVPNCTGCEDRETFRLKKVFAFGEKHTMSFDERFFKTNLPKYGFEARCFSAPYDQTSDLLSMNSSKIDVSSSELMVLAREL